MNDPRVTKEYIRYAVSWTFKTIFFGTFDRLIASSISGKMGYRVCSYSNLNGDIWLSQT